MKVVCILLILAGGFLFLVGLGGAVINFGFPPTGMICDIADKEFKETETAFKDYQAAKGTASESVKENDYESKQKISNDSAVTCGRMKSTYQTYGIIFSVVGVIGVIILLVGAGGFLLGLRKAKS